MMQYNKYRKENYLRAARGERPLHDALVVRAPLAGEPATTEMLFPRIYGAIGTFEAGTDIWGAEYVSSDGSGLMVMPKPNTCILEDVTEWRDVIKAPDLAGYDWDAAAKADLEDLKKNGYDPENSVLTLYIDNCPFIHLTAFMGFENALIALCEEPEECAALFSYLTDFYAEVTEQYCKYLKPDVVSIWDDLSSKEKPFVSLNMFHELFLPNYKRLTEICKKYDRPVAFHICGRGDLYMDDLVGIGVNIWNSAIPLNDLEGIQKKYGNRLLLEVAPEFIAYGATEEKIRQSVRDTIDRYALAGGFAFNGFVLSAGIDAENGARVDEWVADEAWKYSEGYYDRHQ